MQRCSLDANASMQPRIVRWRQQRCRYRKLRVIKHWIIASAKMLAKIQKTSQIFYFYLLFFISKVDNNFFIENKFFWIKSPILFDGALNWKIAKTRVLKKWEAWSSSWKVIGSNPAVSLEVMILKMNKCFQLPTVFRFNLISQVDVPKRT